MDINLRSIQIPDFGVPLDLPPIPAAIYEARVKALYEKAGADWVVVYADREHIANMAFLTGFEPRFEEALLLLGPSERRILVVGNESQSYAPLAGLPGIEIVLSQTMSLMGQDRSSRPNLAVVLQDIGLRKGDCIGLAGWKYLAADEWDGELPSFQAPAFIVDTLRKVAGDPAAVSDATPILMHPETGLRAVVDVHQIAAGEWGSARASAAVWRIVSGVREGDSEYLATSRMGYAGEALSCHTMFASASAGAPVVGLRSPTGRVMKLGDGVTTAVGYWGGLSSRAGLFSAGDDGFLEIAKAYFRGLITWYETAEIGVAGGDLFDAVVSKLAEGSLGSALNPGHLVGYDEWVNSPVRPGSTERIASGMPFQIDVIPVPMPDNWALNCEDSVTFADEELRAELKALYPEVHARIEARRAFMADALGVTVKPSILPLSNIPLCLPPFWLASDQLLVRA
ncbi:Xaa-Pro aminopeptidase [Kaistia algarum]|uniref:M24 family metallopeptidase n=1 Tax=Kaistia algarum TaxID=2083279 RepID=UPI000CE8BCC9|nr:M24 family metallopeptidase [Kaistia algarum]MCX5516746.1 M24 family metallopeptidase [Kaistia algarum]PPE78639.1 Xaa-Pro aminopeptidase [Kaistia algarum]